jgi:pimeloyl-ACP methyl ester carboxylesterase
MAVLRIPSDGLELAAEDSGAGVPFIFAHGLTVNRTQTHKQLAPLADHYRILSFDQRGHAESTPIANAGLFDVNRMAEDITAILDARGIQRAIVGGESMGAATSLRFALNHPQRVIALLLCLPALSDELLAARDTVTAFAPIIRAQGIDAFAARNGAEMLAQGASPQRAAAWSAILRSHQADSLALACETVPNWLVYSGPAELQRLTMPVFIIAIDGDPVHPLALAQRLAATMPHAQLQVVEPDEYGEHPETVGRLCDAFMATINPT